MKQAIVTLDLHGKNTHQARVMIEAALRRSKGVYRLRLIHGWLHGDALKQMIEEEYALHPRVLRLENGTNGGQTDLVLLEL